MYFFVFLQHMCVDLWKITIRHTWSSSDPKWPKGAILLKVTHQNRTSGSVLHCHPCLCTPDHNNTTECNTRTKVHLYLGLFLIIKLNFTNACIGSTIHGSVFRPFCDFVKSFFFFEFHSGHSALESVYLLCHLRPNKPKYFLAFHLVFSLQTFSFPPPRLQQRKNLRCLSTWATIWSSRRTFSLLSSSLFKRKILSRVTNRIMIDSVAIHQDLSPAWAWRLISPSSS